MLQLHAAGCVASVDVFWLGCRHAPARTVASIARTMTAFLFRSIVCKLTTIMRTLASTGMVGPQPANDP